MAEIDELNNEIAKRKKEHVINGFLDLRGSQITKLPNNLTVNGNFYLSNNTGITALPDNLTVNGSLYISGTAITALPETLKVRGSINLSNTVITALPDKLVIGGNVYGLEKNLQQIAGDGEFERMKTLMRQCREEVKQEWKMFYNICLQDKNRDLLLKDQAVPLVFMIEKFAGVVREFVEKKYAPVVSGPENFWGMVFSAISESKTCPEDDIRAALREISKKYTV